MRPGGNRTHNAAAAPTRRTPVHRACKAIRSRPGGVTGSPNHRSGRGAPNANKTETQTSARPPVVRTRPGDHPNSAATSGARATAAPPPIVARPITKPAITKLMIRATSNDLTPTAP